MNPAKNSPRKVLLVDEYEFVWRIFAHLINQTDDLIVCGEAKDVSCAMSAISNSKPDLVVTEIALESSNGLELIKNIRDRYPSLPVLVVTMHDEALYGERALGAGARGYITKQEAIDKIVTGIRKVLSGAFFFSEAMTERIIRQQLRGEVSGEGSLATEVDDGRSCNGEHRCVDANRR